VLLATTLPLGITAFLIAVLRIAFRLSKGLINLSDLCIAFAMVGALKCLRDMAYKKNLTSCTHRAYY
jgi:short subunit fatty acids transporter